MVARHIPAAPLRPYLAKIVEGWEYSGGTGARMREVPIPGVPIILNLGTPWEIESAGRRDSYDSFTGGLHTGPVFVRGGTSWACIELRLTPLGACRLFGRPMQDLSHTTVPLEDVLPRTRDLVERIGDARSWPARFELLDEFLLRRLSDSVEPSREIAWSWQRLAESHGRAPIAELARELGWSHRRLIVRFREHVGLTPKTFARVIRFDRAVRTLRSAKPSSLAGVAFECGYSDQAHLNRDFREFAGTSPTAFLAAQLDSGAIAA